MVYGYFQLVEGLDLAVLRSQSLAASSLVFVDKCRAFFVSSLGDEVHMVVHQAERQYRHIEFQGTYRYAVHSVYVVSPVSEKEFLFKAFSAYMVVFPTLSPHVHSLSPVDSLLQISLLSEVNSIDLFRKFDLRSVAVSIFQSVKELIVFALFRSSRLCRDRISFSGPIALS